MNDEFVENEVCDLREAYWAALSESATRERWLRVKLAMRNTFLRIDMQEMRSDMMWPWPLRIVRRWWR